MMEPSQVTALEAMAWAIKNNIKLPNKKKLAVINQCRHAMHLPPFEIIKDRCSHDPHHWNPPVKSSPIAFDAPMLVCHVNTSVKEQPMDDKISSAGLRGLLITELRDLQAGKSDPKRAIAVAKLASAIIDTVKMEMEFVRLSHENGPTQLEGLPKPLLLT